MVEPRERRGMHKVIHLEEYHLPHNVAEVICLKCLKRWIAVYPEETPLKDIECTCGEVGYVIKTGQELFNEDN